MGNRCMSFTEIHVMKFDENPSYKHLKKYFVLMKYDLRCQNALSVDKGHYFCYLYII